MASAHGDLQSLLKNPSLNSLLGGTTSVTLGDELAKATQGGNKVRHIIKENTTDQCCCLFRLSRETHEFKAGGGS